MMGRVSRQVMFMDMARAASRRSTCFRLNVGAVVVQDNNVLGIGWNGQAAGKPHCAGNDCPGIVPGNCGTIHAEINAIEKAQPRVFGGHHVDLYVTHSPCRNCWYKINTGVLLVDRVFFETPYRETHHLNTGRSDVPHDSRVFEVSPAGYVIDHFTREVVELP